MRAVVFDFFGTLTDPVAEKERRPAFDATAGVLGIEPDVFYTAMSGSFPQRIVGAYGDTAATLLAIARSCGISPTAATLGAAVRTHHAGAERVRRPRDGALATVDTIKRLGFRTGLLSDCSSELCEAWPGTPYAPLIDEPVFSWRERRRKPDPALYATVAARLGVPPASCWYVGDGGSREHEGARLAGMRPVLVTNVSYPGVAAFRTDPDSFIPPHRVDELPDLLRLLRD
ncbi:HAD family hydrolase [Actinoplanes sp. OR16]|uniref:HAD family hydrolase n=1 Tax=Actinoplanes sp. OR16 TaxID=946334 RepID=UPI000FD8D7CD|nr:HAD family hydrolase [Actinoplanes sp. OR16]